MLLTSSREDKIDVQSERKTIVVPSRSPPKPPASNDTSPSAVTDGKTTYYPSETCRLIQEQESGVQSNVSPLTGVEQKTNQSKRLQMLDRALP